MIRIWDYFMRRKGLLLLALVAFVLSGVFSYRLLRGNNVPKPENNYISISTLARPDEDATSATDEESNSSAEEVDFSSVSVIDAREVTILKFPEESTDIDIANHPVEIPVSDPIEKLPEASAIDIPVEVLSPAAVVGLTPTSAPSTTVVSEASPTPEIPLTSTPVPEATNPTYIILLSFAGFIIAMLSCYFVEQHFRR